MKESVPKFCRFAAIFCAIFAFLVSASPAYAKATDLTACFQAAQEGETYSVMAAKPAGFDCSTHQNDLQPGSYWVQLKVPASIDTVSQPMFFRTASLWDNGFELWAVRADGQIEEYRPFEQKDVSPLRLGATVVVSLKRGNTPITDIYAKVHDSAAMRGIMQQSQLSTAEDALRYEMVLAVLYAAFMGLSIALLIYNLALWRGMREPFLLAYCGMLVATLCYAIFTSGAPHYFFPQMSGTDRLTVTIPLLAINATAAMIFIRHFFEASTVPRWLIRATYFASAWAVIFSLFYAAMAPAYVKILDTIYVYNFIPLPLLVVTYAWIAYRRRDLFLGYFLLAWLGPAIGVGLRMLFGFNILPYHILIENSTLIGLTFEALISSLAIGYRVRRLSDARNRAQISEANAMLIADTDPLTGLLNRRAFVRELLSAPRDWQLVLIDIDHFKRVNDTLGHVGGDDVLVTIAAALRTSSPEGSMVARLGGEEFAIATLAPHDGKGLADATALLNAVRTAEMPGGYRITASIGVARRVICEEMDWKVLYRAADMALYRAKAEGRDRYVDYSAERIAA